MADDLILSPIVWDAIRENTIRVQDREFDVSRQIVTLHDALFPPFLNDLNLFFLQNFYTSLRPDKQPGWDLVTAQQIGATQSVSSMLDDLFGDAGDGTDAILDQAIEESTEDGFKSAMWLIAVSGIKFDDDHDFTFPDTATLIAATAIDGLSARARAAQWRQIYRDRILQAYQGLLVTQGTLLETTSITSTLWGEYVRAVAAMTGNELYYSFMVGQHEIWGRFADLLSEVWVTEEDEKVCLICSSLHRQVTHLLPIIHSHPGCRCHKVPVLLIGGQPVPIDYDTFIASLT